MSDDRNYCVRILLLWQTTHVLFKDERITVEDAIEYPYLEDTRSLYHMSLCACCGSDDFRNGQIYHDSKEPRCTHKLDGKSYFYYASI
jgi:hypothetical protein